MVALGRVFGRTRKLSNNNLMRENKVHAFRFVSHLTLDSCTGSGYGAGLSIVAVS